MLTDSRVIQGKCSQEAASVLYEVIRRLWKQISAATDDRYGSSERRQPSGANGCSAGHVGEPACFFGVDMTVLGQGHAQWTSATTRLQ